MILPHKFQITVNIPAAKEIPSVPRGVVKVDNFWRMTALVEGRMGVSTNYLFPGPSRLTSDPIVTLSFDVRSLDLEIKGSDRQTTRQIQRRLGISPATRKGRSVEFVAVLPNTKPVFVNSGTETKVHHKFLGPVGSSSTSDTFIDATTNFDFALIQRGDDLHVHARSRTGYHGKSQQDDRRLFQGLLNAVGFTHGVHPWACRFEYRLNGRKIADQVQACEIRAQSRYVPFSLGWGMGIKENDPRRGMGASLRLAAEFFAGHEPVVDGVSHLLFLYREASDSRTHFGLTTHGLCSVLEGLVREIVEQRSLADPKVSPFVKEFEKAKTAAEKLIAEGLKDTNEVVIKRLTGLVRFAQPFDIREQFKRVCEHLDLPWTGLMEGHFQAWKKERNPSHHGKLRSQRDEEFHHQAMIAGAINLIVLRLVGYRGPAFRELLGHKRDSVVRI